MEKLEAAFGEKSRLAAKGEVRFSSGPTPYELGGDFSLNEFDAGKLFKALEPAKPATTGERADAERNRPVGIHMVGAVLCIIFRYKYHTFLPYRTFG